MFEKAIKFLQSIKPEEKVFILYHDDADGVCSAVLISKFLMLKKINNTIFKPNPKVLLTKELYEEIIENKPVYVITLDLAIDQELEYLLKLKEQMKILVIDHHKEINDISNIKNITLLKSDMVRRDIEQIRYPASKLCYDLINKINDFSNFDYLAAIGMIGDIALDSWPEFKNQVVQKYGIKKLEITSRKIDSFKPIGNIQKAFKIINEAKSLNEINSSKELEENFKKVNLEIEKWKGIFEKNKKVFENKKLILFESEKPEINVLGQVLTVKAITDYPNYSIIALVSSSEDIQIILRNQRGKPSMNKLIRFLVKEVPGTTGGGHDVAAGGNSKLKNFSLIKEKILKNINKC